MTQTSSSRKTRFIAESASMLLLALALSYLESLIPITTLIPLPGFKPGFANIVIIVAFYRLSHFAAALISVSRVAISSLLFSGVTTLAFSLSGAALSFIVLLICSKLFKDKIGFVGLSVLMALFHKNGQLLCAAAVIGNSSLLYYFPALGIAALLCGCITGAVLTAIPNKIYFGKVS